MKDKKIQFLKVALFLGFFVFLLFGARVANAATLYFSPSSGNFSVGDILTMSILVDTQGQSINNSNAVINFPAGLLEVVSVGKSGSIFSLWVEEPAFSNSAGIVSFDGGLPTPGFNGTAGKLLSVVFRVRNAGTASLIFSSGAVRANDGYGTDILQTRAQAQFSLISEERPIVPPSTTLGAPQAPNISSPTHPDPNKWYAVSGAKFTWDLPSGVTGARLLVGKISNAVPTITYIPAISSRELPDLDDGIWYFHVRLQNDADWGGSSHFRFQIDTERPNSFDIQEIKRNDPTNPRARFAFDAQDETSGIDHYEVQIDAGSPYEWRDDGSGVFEAPILGPGKHTLIAKAIDKAGNSLADSTEFVIQALEPPVITEYPNKLTSGEILSIKGKTKYSNAQISLFLQHEKDESKSYSVKSDNAGNFTFVTEDRLSGGTYTAWAEVVDERGARSEPSEKVIIAVEQSALLLIAPWAIGLLGALVLLLMFLAWYWWRKFTTMQKRITKEIREAEHALHKTFDALKEVIREQIRILERAKTRRRLTEEEEKIIEQLEKDLDDAEEFVRKEIEGIKKAAK